MEEEKEKLPQNIESGISKDKDTTFNQNPDEEMINFLEIKLEQIEKQLKHT